MGNFFNIKCEEANQICNKAQYNEATFIEKLKLNWHIMFCKVCKLYSKQNKILTGAYNNCKPKDIDNKSRCLKEEDKQLLKNKIKEIS